ncbi:MAG: hypothetical protein TR69_WS6001000386 [candidate division WS6 bacterium OLB20]|uniref:Uncharacterized protein n=1 Tax=candidate division WS6 bacterium OLB20 TaxID=1617426 RepID=A0A136LXK9_9BACT|nr:MAG: hypothetical protein TR69_WS6001000386 [candidate division WS6 bacterium OLB20]
MIETEELLPVNTDWQPEKMLSNSRITLYELIREHLSSQMLSSDSLTVLAPCMGSSIKDILLTIPYAPFVRIVTVDSGRFSDLPGAEIDIPGREKLIAEYFASYRREAAGNYMNESALEISPLGRGSLIHAEMDQLNCVAAKWEESLSGATPVQKLRAHMVRPDEDLMTLSLERFQMPVQDFFTAYGTEHEFDLVISRAAQFAMSFQSTQTGMLRSLRPGGIIVTDNDDLRRMRPFGETRLEWQARHAAVIGCLNRDMSQLYELELSEALQSHLLMHGIPFGYPDSGGLWNTRMLLMLQKLSQV